MNKRQAALSLALVLAIPAEGLRQYAYRDPVGILTVCYGHTGPDVEAGRRYSLAECRALLDDDMSAALDAVEARFPGLPVEVTASFGDATFNVGTSIIDTKKSTAARHLAAGELVAACNQLPRWNKARVAGVMVALPGLTKRRNAERDFCLRGVRGTDGGNENVTLTSLQGA